MSDGRVCLHACVRACVFFLRLRLWNMHTMLENMQITARLHTVSQCLPDTVYIFRAKKIFLLICFALPSSTCINTPKCIRSILFQHPWPNKRIQSRTHSASHTMRCKKRIMFSQQLNWINLFPKILECFMEMDMAQMDFNQFQLYYQQAWFWLCAHSVYSVVYWTCILKGTVRTEFNGKAFR